MSSYKGKKEEEDCFPLEQRKLLWIQVDSPHNPPPSTTYLGWEAARPEQEVVEVTPGCPGPVQEEEEEILGPSDLEVEQSVRN